MRHSPYDYYSAKLYEDIDPFPLVWVVIYGYILVITYALKLLFLVAVYSYFKYWGGLEDPNNIEASAEAQRMASFIEVPVDEQNKQLNELIESKLKECNIVKDEM